MAFLDEIRAKDYGIYHRLPQTQVVVLAETGAAKAPPPAPATVNQAVMQEEAIMKTKKNSSRIPKQAASKVNGSQSMESLPAHQISRVAGNHQAPSPKSTGNQTAKTPALTEPMTIIEARMDVGFGNSLFIRGHGDGLSWDKGQPLNCVDGTTWRWSTRPAKGKLVFKLLLNDAAWASGEDLVVEAGRKIEVVPQF